MKRYRFTGLAFALGIMTVLAGCDTTRQVADAINPMQLFEDDEETAESIEPKPVPGDEEEFPAIGAVPARPDRPQIADDADALREGLTADRENAQYTDQVIRQSEEGFSSEGPVNPPVLSSVPPPEPPVATIAPPSAAPPVVATAPAPRVVTQSAPAAAPAPVSISQQARSAAEEADRLLNAGGVTRTAAATRTVNAPPAPEPVNAPQSPAVTPIVPPSPPGQTVANAAPAAPAVQPAAATAEQIATLYFPSGGASLNANDRNVISQVAEIYRSSGGRELQVVGHASGTTVAGDRARQDLANYKVSLDRATAVAQALLQLGVPSAQLNIAAMSARQPRYREDSPNGIAGNQRVELFIVR